MHHRAATAAASLIAPTERLKSWEWASREVNFNRAPEYETELTGAYDPEYMPWWKEVAEAVEDRSVREVWVWKNSRAGCSENVALMPIRYKVARSPVPVLYITGDQQGAEQFMEERIKKGFALSEETKLKYAQARVREHEIYFPDMALKVGWPTNVMTMKQAGYAFIVLDEFSVYRGYSKAMYEKRTGNWAHSTLLGLSSMDPTQNRPPEEDPIYIEWSRGDRREWMCLDPATGNPFRFVLGRRDEPGLQWDPGAKHGEEWDLNALDAHYITPDGTRIDESDRIEIVRGGMWEPTNPNAEKGVRSYRSTSFMSPFKDGHFDMIARRFLRAKMATNPRAMLVFMCEEMAELHHVKTETAPEEAIADRVGDYAWREQWAAAPAFQEAYKDKPRAVFITVDVQKDHLWVCVREWSTDGGGDSGLIYYGRAEAWEEIFTLAEEYKPQQIFCDCAYEMRQREVYEVAGNTPGFVPVLGNDKLKDTLYRRDTIDPWEGTRRQGSAGTIIRYTFKPDTLRSVLVQLMTGEARQKWFVPRGVTLEYQRQVTALERRDGVWVNKRRDEHAFDCEVMQILAALRHGIFKSTWLNQEQHEKGQQEQ